VAQQQKSCGGAQRVRVRCHGEARLLAAQRAARNGLEFKCRQQERMVYARGVVVCGVRAFAERPRS